MKSAENVDGRFKNGFSSMKRAKNMDDKLISALPSMKIVKNVDENIKNKFPSMKSGEIVDGKLKLKTFFEIGNSAYASLWIASPERSLGSNHVVLGGMMLPESAISTSCFIETG